MKGIFDGHTHTPYKHVKDELMLKRKHTENVFNEEEHTKYKVKKSTSQGPFYSNPYFYKSQHRRKFLHMEVIKINKTLRNGLTNQ